MGASGVFSRTAQNGYGLKARCQKRRCVGRNLLGHRLFVVDDDEFRFFAGARKRLGRFSRRQNRLGEAQNFESGTVTFVQPDDKRRIRRENIGQLFVRFQASIGPKRLIEIAEQRQARARKQASDQPQLKNAVILHFIDQHMPYGVERMDPFHKFIEKQKSRSILTRYY
uniref:Uncharacterized protein n=1 Tax=[Caldibacillus] cellulovorans TaxID=74586 RepID=Q9RFX4_9BACL|nr:unknown [[Caldibacillus] cellulovorans]